MEKNQEYIVKIEDMSLEGEGVGKVDGYALFVKDTIIGDEVRVKITKTNKTYGYARLMEVIEPSPHRIQARCPIARQCGGCNLQELSYDEQLKFKRSVIQKNIKRIGGLNDVEVQPVIGMDEPFFYRNKSQFPVGEDKDGNIKIGFYAGRTHSIIETPTCYIGAPVNEPIVKAVREFMVENKIRPYNETTHSGAIRHILIRCGYTTGEIMVCIVINQNKLPHADKLVDKLLEVDFSDVIGNQHIWDRELSARSGQSERKDGQNSCGVSVNGGQSGKIDGQNSDELPVRGGQSEKKDRQNGDELPVSCRQIVKAWHIKSIMLNVNTRNTNVILGSECRTLWGNPYIEDYIGDVKYRISPLSFYQVNPVQTRKLYNTALDYAGLTGNEVVWDLYCGIGTISLFLARRAKKVYGVEIVPQAIEDAKENAKLNNIDNAKFFVGKAEEVLTDFYEKESARLGRKLTADVIVVDPPRKGCDETLLATMVNMEPEKIVYVSCDSATLARDLKYLCANGYEVKKCVGCDMFPQTGHVETVCLLSKLHEAKHHVNVRLDMDEMDLTAAESKATYEEIKKYVAEHNDGMKVSNLYIAQVKAKYGIIERENYNLSNSEKAKQPKCPGEKEKAIVQALKAFKMIKQ